MTSRRILNSLPLSVFEFEFRVLSTGHRCGAPNVDSDWQSWKVTPTLSVQPTLQPTFARVYEFILSHMEDRSQRLVTRQAQFALRKYIPFAEASGAECKCRASHFCDGSDAVRDVAKQSVAKQQQAVISELHQCSRILFCKGVASSLRGCMTQFASTIAGQFE